MSHTQIHANTHTIIPQALNQLTCIAGTPSKEHKDFVGAKFYCIYTISDGS